MRRYPKYLEELIGKLTKFPGVGRKSAERIMLYLLESESEETKKLGYMISNLKQHIRACRICNNFTQSDICYVCDDPKRDKSLVCIVEEPKDVAAIEESGSYNGTYHVLLGNVSFLNNKTPEKLRLKQLIDRIKQGGVEEIIIATDTDADGETTAAYIYDKFKKAPVKITRIGQGIPAGSDLEFIDPASLGKAFQFRKTFES